MQTANSVIAKYRTVLSSDLFIVPPKKSLFDYRKGPILPDGRTLDAKPHARIPRCSGCKASRVHEDVRQAPCHYWRAVVLPCPARLRLIYIWIQRSELKR